MKKHKAKKARKIDPVVRERNRAASCVPVNWLHPLLTGPSGIGEPPYNCHHIEYLLCGIRAAIRGKRTNREKP